MSPLSRQASRAYWESDEALERLSSWYAVEKEHHFLDYIFSHLKLPSTGLIIEVGGGAGIHGRILAERFRKRYLFTDLSEAFVNHARRSGLPAEQMDGLALEIDSGSAACVFLMATATILLDQETRDRQFCECARVLRPDGVAIFVTARSDRRYHFWNSGDMESLARLGFETTRLNWGIIPGTLWNSKNQHIFSFIERFVAKTNLSARAVLLARRRLA